jgi:hypothetical protein
MTSLMNTHRSTSALEDSATAIEDWSRFPTKVQSVTLLPKSRGGYWQGIQKGKHVRLNTRTVHGNDTAEKCARARLDVGQEFGRRDRECVRGVNGMSGRLQEADDA